MKKKTVQKKKDITLSELGEMMTHVVKHMATKEDLSELKTELKADIERLDTKLTARIDYVASSLGDKIRALDSRLGGFENHEVDKRVQLEVRTTRLEQKVFGVTR